MFRLTRAQVQPIGLDIGFDSVKLLQLETVGQSLAVVGAARQMLPAEARESPELRMPAVMDAIRQAMKNGSFRGREVIAALPREIVHVKNLRLPLFPPHELQQAVVFEARNIFPFDTENAHVQMLPAGEVRQGLEVRQEVVVLTARHEDVDAFVESVHGCGLTLASLDAEPCAIYRAFEKFIRRREDEQEVHVILDVGARRTQVVIGKGRELSFLKSIELGSHHLQDAVARKLGISLEEARALRRRLIESFPVDLADARKSAESIARSDPVRQAVFDATRSTMEEIAREVALCLRYHAVTFRGQKPTRAKLVGGESCDAGLIAVLSAGLCLGVEPARPLYSVDTSAMKPQDRRGAMGEWTLAFGLGLKLTRGHFGARDGKPRDPRAPWPVENAEVIDLDQVLSRGGANPQREDQKSEEQIHA